jgi:solute carrier family 27 fatty acid transporter 1/4
MGGLGVHHFHNFKTEDIFYTSLPLYHSAGGMLGTGQVIIFGSTMALRKKFSVSNFWSDCIAYKVTVIQYIGEICRYLLAQPESPHDKEHKVRLMFGNGLRREIWEKFVRRFGIPEVGEFYASTEGNANITNIDSTVGSVGFVPRLLYPLVHFKIIRVNEQTGEIIRDPKTGLAIICKPNESGEFVGTIIRNHIYKDFQGYVGSASSEQKIARNIFKAGDTVFRSGDLMIMDELGYFYFKDRCGDTFRWKGENVSTNEVEAIISSTTQLKDCVVYGVQIIGTEGKAGMAAIVDDNANLDLDILARSLERKLPVYARPLFLRITAQIDATGTYKLKKIDLQKEGFDIQQVTDPVYFFQNGKYVPLDSQLYKQILAGEVRL